MIQARSRAGLTQEEVATRMKITQAVVARPEAGGSKPSTRTLEKFAKATGSRLKISFEPTQALSKSSRRIRAAGRLPPPKSFSYPKGELHR